MIWDKLSPFYDFFENIYNGKCYKGIAEKIREYVTEDDIVMLVATLYDQTENRLLDVKTKVCKFGELSVWTAELSVGDKTDLGYKVFLINTENHGPIMKQIAEIL